MEDQNFLQETNPLATPLNPQESGEAAFKSWADNLSHQDAPDFDPGIPNLGPKGGGNPPMRNIDIASEFNNALEKSGKTEDTSKFAYNTADISKRYKANFKGIDNEELYAQSQTTLDKAYNGVVKFAGTAATTFINGTVGTVYGTIQAVADGKISSFYNNGLSNRLNDMSNEWEDTYAHYKTQREREGDWYEPANLFTANFLFDNIIKNLGFSVGAMGAGFAWGGALKAIGLTSKLAGIGGEWAAQADTVISESALLPEAERMGSLSTKLEGIFNSAKSVAGSGLMKADRGIVATFGTFGEAGMEALNNSKEYRNKAIENYRKTYGVDPTGKELSQINADADSVGDWSFGLNTALLSVTNYVQLPKIYSSSFKAEKNIMNGVVRAGEEYVSSLPSKGFGKLFYKAKNLAGLAFETSEAFEEGAQFAIQTGTQNYFDRKSKDKSSSALADGLLYGVKEALTSSEGMLNIFTGGFSGALQSSGIVGRKGLMPTIGQTGKIGERGLTGYGGTDKVEREQAIKDLNDTRIKNKMKDALDNIKAGESIQQDREIAISQGDILESKDLEFDYAHTFVETRLKYKAKDSIDFEIESLKEQAMSKEGFNKLKQEGFAPDTDTATTFIARLNNLQDHANHSAKLYDSLNTKYSAIMDKDGKRKYDDLVIDKLVYNGAKINDYTKRMTTLNTDLTSKGVLTQSVMDAITDQGMPTEKALDEAFNNIIAMPGITDDVKLDMQQDLTDLIEMGLRKNSSVEEYNSIIKNPENHKEQEKVEVTEKKPGEPVETITIKTKNGDREIEIGTEYVRGKVVRYSKTGKEVYEQPKLTVLGKNENGTFKIKEADGSIVDVTAADLEKYSLTKASELETNRKFKFFYEHQNSIFIHRKYKDANGKPVKGRLTYNTKDKRKLNFVFRDKNGKLKSVPAWNFMFKAKKGFKQPMIEMIGTLTADQRTAQEKFTEEQEADVAERNEQRFEIMAKLSEDVIARHATVTKLIEDKTAQLEKEKKKLAETEAQIAVAPADKRFKIFRWKQVTSEALGVAKRLSRSVAELEASIAALVEEQEELSYTKDYIDDFAMNLEEMPHLGKDMMFQLKYEALVIQDAIDSNVKTISGLKGLVNSLEKAIDSAVDMLTDMLGAFGRKFPNVPSPNGQPWVDFLKSNPNFLKNKPTFKAEYTELEDYLAYVEDTEITPKEKRVKEVKEHVEIIEGELRDLDKQLTAHNAIVERFQKVAQEYREGKRQEAEQKYNADLKDAFIGINDNSQQNTTQSGEYEPISKKNEQQVGTSTTVPVSDKDHHVRADKFAHKFNELPNKDEIRGLVVTHANEDLILGGLTEFLAIDPTTKKLIDDVDPKKTIAMVFVRETEDGPVLVDVNGNDIDDENTNKLNEAIFQVFPAEDLENTYGSMFRTNADPVEVDKVKKYYKGWSKEQLENESLGDMHEVSPSFGILDYVTYDEPDAKTGKPIKIRDYAARIPVLDSGLVTEEDLQAEPVVMVGIEDNISNDSGTQEFENAKGKVFLRSKGGLVPLDNRKFTAKEVNVMFDAMMQAAKNAVRDGNLKHVDTQRFFQWLRSVSYWGTAKDQEGNPKLQPGYNNIWFDNVIDENGESKTMLFISGKGFKVDFTPTGLTNNSSVIKGLLKDLYFNTRAPMVNNNDTDKWNTPYREIIGIDKNGEPITLKWQNYQTFLLSPLKPTQESDGLPVEPRSADEIPLTTNVRPLLGPEDRNRKYIYFTMNNVYESLKPAKKAPKPPKPKKQGAKKGTGAKYSGTITGIYLDGKTPNYVHMDGEDYAYTVDANDITDITNGGNVFAAAKFENEDYTGDIILGMQAKNILTFDFTDPADNAKIRVATAKKVIPAIRAEYLAQQDAAPENNEDPLDEEDWEDINDEEEEDTEEEQEEEQEDTEEEDTEDSEEEEEPVKKKTTKKAAKKVEDEGEWADISDDDEYGVDISLDDIEADEDVEGFRVALQDENQYNLTTEKWDEVEKFVKQSFPNIPFYRVKNIIQATNGRQAWGMLQDGAIYVYENAEVGTAYHEIFEAVWKMAATHEERLAINKEFRARTKDEGKFWDRESQKYVPYATATPHQIKEQLAEEFRDYVMKENPQPKSLIERMFQDLINFIKSFFVGKDSEHNTNQLFERIGNGFYSQYNPFESQLSYAQMGIQDIEEIKAGPMAEFRIEDIPVAQQIEILQHMTFTMVKDATQTNEGLFNVTNENKKELYTRLYKAVQGRIKTKILAYEEHRKAKQITEAVASTKINWLKRLAKQIEDNRVAIFKKHENHVKAYGISFDEVDEENTTDDSRRKDDSFGDSRQIDSFRKASPAVKLLLSTLPEMEIRNDKRVPKLSSIGGNIILPGDRVFITLMNQLHQAINPDDMMNRLRVAALKDINYIPIYYRLTGVEPTGKASLDPKDAVGVNYDKMDKYDLDLIFAFWKTMKKQNADAITVFVLPSGETVVSDSTLTSAAKQSKRDMANAITDTIKSGNSPFFKYENGKFSSTTAVKNHKLTSTDLSTYTRFLEKVGVTFTEKELKGLNDDQAIASFRENVERMKRSFDEASGLVIINPQTLKIDGRLFNLGVIKATIENPDFESTYFNLNGDKTQTFLGTNIISAFHDVMSKIKHINEVDDNPLYSQYKYLKTDVFTQGSQILKKMFTDSGKRRVGTEDLFKAVYIDGTVNEDSGKKTESSKLTYKQRLIQEINANLDGVFMNLVPGDASIEWGIRMFANKDTAFVGKNGIKDGDYKSIFQAYFQAEVNLARDNRTVVKHKERGAKDLRFFKDILPGDLYTKVMKEVLDKNKTPLQVYTSNKAKIDGAVLAFIEKEAKKTVELLDDYQIIGRDPETDTIKLNSIELPEYNDMDELLADMKVLAVNYMISNIEMHKLIYSDPYQYSDELKRIKNFNSPRQPLVFGSEKVNTALHRVYNEDYKSGDIGYTDMNVDHFRTATASDVQSDNPNKDYDDPYKESDGGGYISARANRVFGIRSGDWTADNERQYRYDIAYEKFHRGQGKNEKQRAAEGLTMSKSEIELFEKGNPGVKDTYTPKKPIAAGNKANGRNFNDIVLHKYALVPISYRIMHELDPNSNMVKLYEKMQKENVDYVVFDSGVKVGAEAKHDLYKKNGEFNDAPFETQEQIDHPEDLQGITNIPFSILSVQSEVPSKDSALVRQGTQITKLATMDFMEAGVPIDYRPDLKTFDERFAAWTQLKTMDEKTEASTLHKEIINNQRLLEAKIAEGYQIMLHKLGIEETTVKVKGVTKKAFKLGDVNKLVDTLKDEVLKREINENIIYALDDIERGAVIIEATPVYQQIRNILFSIADKNVVKPKISGGMKVQIPSTLLESGVRKVKEVGNKTVYESDVLKFYSKTEDGKAVNVAEIMVGRWFKSDMTDDQLLDLWYVVDKDGNRTTELTPEGKKVLGGVGFRIPTQKQNSIDVFVIKKFLPADFGDSVVIPSALVKKAGSDFDIDKLSIYLKNVYKNSLGEPVAVPFYGIGQEGKDEFAKRYDAGEYLTKKQLDAVQRDIDLFRQGQSEGKLVKEMFSAFFKEEEDLTVKDVFNDFIAQLEEDGAKKTVVDGLYMQSLENAYIESLEALISRPENYDNLVKPNDASQLSDLAKVINSKLKRDEIDYSNPGNMLSRAFMSSLRQAFVSGKYAIGIAAVGQTGHAQRQRTPSFIDVSRMDLVPLEDQEILGADPLSLLYATNPNINFEKYNSAVVDDSGMKKPLLSMIKNKDGEYISDLNGMFIDGYVDISKGPWIMELGATPNVTPTWLFLIDLGVPINTIAFFMNQPIIREYLKQVENQGYSWLFIKPIVENMMLEYSGDMNVSAISKIPSETSLGKTVGMDKTTMNSQQLAEQQFILKEFLKYAKLASHQFQVTQGSNFDTATLNDPYLIFKKLLQYEKGKRTLISSIDKLTDASFVGVLRDHMYDIRDAMATVLLSDRNNTTDGRTSIRNILEEVLLPFVDMNDRDFVKISQKAVSDLFDWAVQTKPHGDKGISMNVVISDILLGSSTKETAAKEIINYRDSILKKPSHALYSNLVLRSLKLESGNKKANLDSKSLTERKGKTDNLSITAKDGKAFNQDLIIGAFKELRDNKDFQKTGLYEKLVRVAVLQSGLTNSPISFSHLLPYEDFRKVYNATLSTLETMPGLEKYLEVNAFQRNNWANTDIVTQHKAIMRKSKKTDKMYNSNEAFLDKRLKDSKIIPKVVNISVGTVSGRSDFITYSWTDETIKHKDRTEMRKKGDFSYINKILMQKVYTDELDKDGNLIPLIQKSNFMGTDYYNYIYKGINAWGDSFRSKEFYSAKLPSVIDNGYETVTNEVEDVIITNIMNNIPNVQKAVQNKQSATKTATVREYTPENITVLQPNEVFVFGANTAGGHGGGAAGLAQRSTTTPNYSALATGTKGRWAEYGVTEKLMEGKQGKSFGIITKSATITGNKLTIGGKRSVPLKRIGESVDKLLATATKNPNLKFLVSKFGTGMAGFTENEMKSLFVGKKIPDNVVLPKEYETRGVQPGTKTAPAGKTPIKKSDPKCK